MAIDFGSLQMRLNPLSPINPGQIGQMGMERQRLALAREQFENTKKQQEEQNRLHELAEQGQMARAQMQGERAKAKAEAAAAAKLQEQKLATYQKFTELNGAGDLAGARTMVPLMSSLGMGVEVQGEEGGFPRYRISMDSAKDAAQEDQRAAVASPYGQDETSEQSLSRMAGMGLEGESGTLDDPQLRKAESAGAEPGSVGGASSPLDAATLAAASPEEDEHPLGAGAQSGLAPAGLPGTDAYAQALAASQYAREHGGKALRAPDKEDYTGSIPSDVIDTGAQHQLTLATLKPGLQSLAAAYPDEESRASAAKTAEGIEAMPLSGEKAIEAYKSQRGGPDAIMVANAQADRFRETRDDLTPKQIEEFKTMGTKDAEKAFKTSDVQGAWTSMEAAKTVTDLMKGDKRNQEKAVNYLMLMTHNKGPQTEADALRVIGKGQLNTIEQLEEWLHKKVEGGFSTEEIQAIQEFVDGERERNKSIAFDYLDRMGARASDPTSHELRRAGVKQFVDDNVPNWVRAEYEQTKKAEAEEDEQAGVSRERQPTAGKDRGATPNYAAMSDFDLELEGQAMEAGLDPDAMRSVVGHESGGRGDAVNGQSGATGIIQFMPDSARSVGTTTEELAKMSPAEQLPYAVKYFKDRGITEDSKPEDYAMAVAAPAFIGQPDDAVVYAKGTKAWEQNAPWRPADGGDITVGDILKFYGMRGGGKGADPAAAAVAHDPELDAEVLGIMKGQ